MPSEAHKWATQDPLRDQVKFVQDDSFIPKKHCCKSCGDGGDCGGNSTMPVVDQEGSALKPGAGGQPRPTSLSALLSGNRAAVSSIGFDPTNSSNVTNKAWPRAILKIQSPRGEGRRIRDLIDDPETTDRPTPPSDPRIRVGPVPLDPAKRASDEAARRAKVKLDLELWLLWMMCFTLGAKPKDYNFCMCIKVKWKPRSFAEFKRALAKIGGKGRDCREHKRRVELAARELEFTEADMKPPPVPPLEPLPPGLPPGRDATGKPTPRMSAKPTPTPLSMEREINYQLQLVTGEPHITWQHFRFPECLEFTGQTLEFWDCLKKVVKNLVRLWLAKEEGRRHRGRLRAAGDMLQEALRTRMRQAPPGSPNRRPRPARR